jgi:Niemann-Pick C1 protein
VFPYSLVYVYYESYLTVWEEALAQLLISLAAIMVVLFVLTGMDTKSTLIMTLVITMVLVDMFGLMYFWNIQLNGVSLINLVVTVGISVEFVSHITKAFTMTIGDSKDERVKITLAKMGTSVRSCSHALFFLTGYNKFKLTVIIEKIAQRLHSIP